ncbi:hypothetical protein [Granulicella mallensis]|uniref:Cyanate lyase n=1 Tax=Granulicella mallensis TaxID=940614 RepID=A0A7W8E8S3_9BACT|nr:hypothetical protein [Granulicella mallensis]MBB5063047.1 cyanate lyase [Granulicella mallensis]
MPRSEFSQAARLELTSDIHGAKSKKDLTDGTGPSIAFVAAALSGQHALHERAAEVVGKKLDLNTNAVALLQSIPMRGNVPGHVATSITFTTCSRSTPQP